MAWYPWSVSARICARLKSRSDEGAAEDFHALKVGATSGSEDGQVRTVGVLRIAAAPVIELRREAGFLIVPIRGATSPEVRDLSAPRLPPPPGFSARIIESAAAYIARPPAPGVRVRALGLDTARGGSLRPIPCLPVACALELQRCKVLAGDADVVGIAPVPRRSAEVLRLPDSRPFVAVASATRVAVCPSWADTSVDVGASGLLPATRLAVTAAAAKKPLMRRSTRSPSVQSAKASDRRPESHEIASSNQLRIQKSTRPHD
eukprot:GHVT01013104.1.p2 GENE.GHVT01013104.1~~GHVT01013104.1.p2  ORF type:complete len:262 (+),score=16.80 GHVT01013104.1:1685-2470(+)